MSKDITGRVAERYASAVNLDEKMKTLLLKLRKGADASLTPSMLFKVLALLGGWEVEKFVGLVKQHGYGDKPDAPHILGEKEEEPTRRQYELLKKDEVSSLPTRPTVGRQYVLDLEPFHSWMSSWGWEVYGAKYKSWVGAEGYRFRDPEGRTFEWLPSKYDKQPYDLKGFRTYNVLPWLKKETVYLEQINGILGMDPHEKAAPRTRDNTGTCAVCFRNIKLIQKVNQDAVMAVHGYNRPGHGYIIGRCWGGEYPPYELSSKATELVLKDHERRLIVAKARLKELQSDKLKEFNENEFNPNATTRRMVVKSELGPDLWAYSLRKHIDRAEREADGVEVYMKIFRWLVQNWKVRDLPKEGDKFHDWFTEATRHVGKS